MHEGHECDRPLSFSSSARFSQTARATLRRVTLRLRAFADKMGGHSPPAMSDRAARAALLVAVMATLSLAACASGGRSTAAKNLPSCRSAPVDSMFLGSGPVYGACEVDRQATMIGRPTLAPRVGTGMPPRPVPTCERADVEFVVDAQGVARADRIRTVRSNSLELLQALRDAVPTMRFTPALKDGQPVAQLFRYGTIRTTSVRAAGSPPPARPPRRC